VLGDARPLRIWGWLVVGVLLAEALLHTPLGDRIPEAGKWGNERLASIVAGAEDYRTEGPVELLLFGSSQGATWIDEQDLRTRGLRTVNASVPGGNTVLADLLGSKLFVPTLNPKLVVITLGPMSLSAWNQHFVQAVQGSPVGGPILRGDRGAIWINEHLMLIRKGGQTMSGPTVRAWKQALLGRPAPAVAAEAATNFEAQLTTLRSQRPDPAQFAAMRHLRDVAEAAGATVVFINMPVRDGAKVGADWNYDEYLAELRRATAGYPLLDLDALAQEQHFSDYSHPSPAGREAMRGAVADFVRAQLDGAKRP
jgi:hypothetical protein